MHRDYHYRKLTHRHRFHDDSQITLMDIIRFLRRRRLRRDISRKSPLTHPRGFLAPLANHDLSPVQSPSHHTSRYRSYATSILTVTEEDCSSGMSTSRSSSPESEAVHSDMDRRHNLSSYQNPIPTFPTSPSMFRLRSISTKDYQVAQLEQSLGRLCLGDAHHPFKNSSRETSMEVSPQGTIDQESSSRIFSQGDTQYTVPSPHDQNLVPLILITSADAKHPRPLSPSNKRPSRTPFGSSNLGNHHTNVSRAESERKLKMQLYDDPFTTQPGPCYAACHPPNDLTFRLPSVSLAEQWTYAPETPTPMCCDHLGDCSGDLWEVLHPPLVLSRFTLPPFTLPPLRTDLFNDIS